MNLTNIIKFTGFVIGSILSLMIFSAIGIYTVILAPVSVVILYKLIFSNKKEDLPIIVDEYWMKDGDNKIGPFTIEQLKQRTITSETMIIYKGLNHWTPAGNIEILASKLNLQGNKTELNKAVRIKEGSILGITIGMFLSLLGGILGIVFGYHYAFGNYKKETKNAGIVMIVLSYFSIIILDFVLTR